MLALEHLFWKCRSRRPVSRQSAKLVRSYLAVRSLSMIVGTSGWTTLLGVTASSADACGQLVRVGRRKSCIVALRDRPDSHSEYEIGMKLSQEPRYREYMLALAKGELSKAAIALETCIRRARTEKDDATHALLLQQKGDLRLKRAVAESTALFERAERTDRHSLLAKYETAKFMACKLHEFNKAIGKCDEIIARSETHERSDSDFSPEHYRNMAHALRGFCCARIGDYDAAERSLGVLVDAEGEVVLDFAMSLCEVLIETNHSPELARAYVRRLVERLQLKRDPQYDALLRRIAVLLDYGRGAVPGKRDS